MVTDEFESPDISEQPAPGNLKGSSGKLIALIVTIILLFGGLVWFGVWWFSAKDSGALAAGTKVTPPEVAVKNWYSALANNQPQALWSAQPPALKQDLVDRVKKMGAAAAEKPKLYQKGMGVARNFAQLTRDKKGVFLGLLDYKPKAASPVNQLDDLQSAVGSILGDGAPADGLKIPDLGDVVGNLAGNMVNAQIAAMMKEHKVEPWKLDATAGILFTLLDSDIKNVNWLQNPDLDSFVDKTGSALMKQLDVIPGQEGEDSWESGFKARLKGIQVKPISQDGDTAVVEVTYPPMAFLGTSAGVKTLQMARVDGEWKLLQPDLIFGAMQAGIGGVDAKVKTLDIYQTVVAQVDGIEGSSEEELIDGLDDVDKIIVEINRDVQTTDDFVAYLGKKFLNNVNSALGNSLLGVDPGGNPKPAPVDENATSKQSVAGTIPNRPAGKANTATKTGNAGLSRGTHRGYLWLAYYNQASLNTGRETGYSIERTFINKRQELLLQAFGDPDEMQNGKWIYRGLRVYDMRKKVALQTVVFNIVNRRVASVVSY